MPNETDHFWRSPVLVGRHIRLTSGSIILTIIRHGGHRHHLRKGLTMEWPQATTGACQKGKYQNMHAPVFFMYREQKQGPITCTTVRFTNEQTYDTCLYVKVFWNIHEEFMKTVISVLVCLSRLCCYKPTLGCSAYPDHPYYVSV